MPQKYYKMFNKLIISCEDNLRKPDPHIYALMLRRLGVKNERVLFLDDMEDNRVEARKFGMKNIQFANNKKFFKEMKTLGIESI